MTLIVSDAVTDVAMATEKLRADDRVTTSPDELLGDIESLLDARRAIDAALVRKLRTAYAVDATSELCGRPTKRWLIEEQLLPGSEASRFMRLVHHLPTYPLTEAAYDAGEIGVAHVAAILTALQSLPCDVRETVEPHLLERARFYPPEEIAGFVDELLQGLGHDRAADVRRERRYNSRGVDIAQTMDGTRTLNGTLTPEVGAPFEAALAMASQKAGLDDDRTPRQRLHDALGVIANAFLASMEPSFTGAPRTVILTMDLQTLEDRLRDAVVALPLGGQISAETARRLACDAELIPAVLGRKGEVLDIGQADHEFTAAIRRAAYVRDGGRCAFPICGNRCIELHHIVFRRHGGPTSLDNAAWLCAYHHWLVHEGGWTLQRQPVDGSYQWTSPHGRQLVRHLGTA